MALNWIGPFRKTHADFDEADTSTNATLYVAPANMMVHDVYEKLVTDFSGGAVSAATISVGTAASTAAFMAAKDCFTGAVNTFAGGNVGGGAKSGVVAAGTAITCTVATTTANTTALTAGVVDIWLLVSRIPTTN